MTWYPDQPRVGYWMVRVARNCPFVAARIWWEQTTTDPVSGEPMDRSPFLAAQIGLNIVRWQDVWSLVEFVESSSEQQDALVNPPLSDRAPRNGRARALKWAPLSKWKQQRAMRITEAQYEAELRWHEWAARNAPSHPDFNFRHPVDLRAAPVPRF